MRRRFVFGFGLIMLLLLVGAEWVLPGWLRMFVGAIRQYHQYTQNQSVLRRSFGWRRGRILGGLSMLAVRVCLVARSAMEAAPRTRGISRIWHGALPLVLALTVLIVPMYRALQSSTAGCQRFWHCLERELRRVLRSVGPLVWSAAVALVWPWIATAGPEPPSVWLTPRCGERWKAPFYATFSLAGT